MFEYNGYHFESVSSWGLYGKAYKENADNYFKED